MKYGVSIIPNTGIMPITELAVAVEERGLDALFMGEHIHIPVKPRIPYPLPTMSAEYLRELDLIVALAGAAAVTRRIKLASGVCLVTAHDPIILAKQFASLDVLSGAASLSEWAPDGSPRSRLTALPSKTAGRCSRSGSKR